MWCVFKREVKIILLESQQIASPPIGTLANFVHDLETLDSRRERKRWDAASARAGLGRRQEPTPAVRTLYYHFDIHSMMPGISCWC